MASNYELREREALPVNPRAQPSAPPPDIIDVEATASSNYVPTPQTTSGPPPSYVSLFGKVKEIKNNSAGPMDFVRTGSKEMNSSYCLKVILSILVAFFLSSVVMGFFYLNDCPAQKNIPIFLIVLGCFGIYRVVMGLLCNFKGRGENGERKSFGQIVVFVIDMFIFSWYIVGNVWIYMGHDNYCHPRLFYFAFWAVTVSNIILAVFVFILFCAGFIWCFMHC